jgi:hypothetical protein
MCPVTCGPAGVVGRKARAARTAPRRLLPFYTPRQGVAKRRRWICHTVPYRIGRVGPAPDAGRYRAVDASAGAAAGGVGASPVPVAAVSS